MCAVRGALYHAPLSAVLGVSRALLPSVVAAAETVQ